MEFTFSVGLVAVFDSLNVTETVAPTYKENDVGGVMVAVLVAISDAVRHLANNCFPSFPVSPFSPVLAIANENFLLITKPSTDIGTVASHATLITAVVLNVIIGDKELLFSTEADIPVGHTMSSDETLILQGTSPQYATISVEHVEPAGAPSELPWNV